MSICSHMAVAQGRTRQRQDGDLLPAGLAFSRWTTEATVMQEFKQYGHYMQPRIHKMVQEVPVALNLLSIPILAHAPVHPDIGLLSHKTRQQGRAEAPPTAQQLSLMLS